MFANTLCLLNYHDKIQPAPAVAGRLFTYCHFRFILFIICYHKIVFYCILYYYKKGSTLNSFFQIQLLYSTKYQKAACNRMLCVLLSLLIFCMCVMPLLNDFYFTGNTFYDKKIYTPQQEPLHCIHRSHCNHGSHSTAIAGAAAIAGANPLQSHELLQLQEPLQFLEHCNGRSCNHRSCCNCRSHCNFWSTAMAGVAITRAAATTGAAIAGAACTRSHKEPLNEET